jgi:type I restriction enzyme S subunit
VSEDWRQSTWGAEISLEYGKAIRGYQHAVAPYRVFGSNGPIGWTESALAAGPGVILGRKGAYRGVQFSTEPFFVIDTAYFVKPKTELDMRWLYYAIIHHKLGEIDDGSPIPSTTRAAVYVRDVDVPSLPEQRAIAATLGALDDKIDLNRRMNETLEAMARALFRDWFFDFGPTRAKMAGTTPYLSPDLWSLFPDRLDDEGKPEGWEMRPVGDFAELKGGKQLEKKHISDTGPVPVFGGAGVMGFTTNHNADGFVISVGRVGAYCGQFFSHRGRSWINNNASLIRPNLKVSGEWLLISLRHIDMDVIKKGAAQPFVSNGDIAKVGIIWPSHAIVSAFSETLVSLMKKAEANEQESRTLAQTRDLLLPRLMSGELRVAEADQLVEAPQ